MTTNKTVLAWLDEMVEMCQPDKVTWIDGSDEQLEALRAEAVASGEIIPSQSATGKITGSVSLTASIS